MIKPFAKNVLLEPIKETSQTSSGVLLPEGNKEKPQKGIVIAVGKEAEEAKVGDRVIYKKWAANEIKDDKMYVLVEEKDILGSYE